MSRSTAQFNLRPGVGGVPPITVERIQRWFNVRVSGDQVTVDAGRVYYPAQYNPTATSYETPFNQLATVPATVTLLETSQQVIVIRFDFTRGHTETVGDPLYAVFDESAQSYDGSQQTDHTVESSASATLYGTMLRVGWHLYNSYEILCVDAADENTATDVLIAEVAYDSVEDRYTVIPRHDGAIFLFPTVWPLTWSVDW
jgi:hypothetical protein